MFLYVFVCAITFSICSFSQIATESNPHRGIYADMFYKRLPSGEIDQSVTILSVDTNRDGIFEQEDAFLQYCADNHFTYIALYDLRQILGRGRIAWNENTRQWEDMEKHLCRFMKKAKEEYCITQIGAISGNASTFDSILTYMDRYPVTEPYVFRPEQINSPAFSQRLRMAEQTYPDGSKEQFVSEFIKFFLRVTDLNSCGDCGADFDVLNSELEFWYECANDYPDFADLVHHMYDIKQLHNNLRPDEPVITEAYISGLYYCTTPYSMLDAARLMDGCSVCSPCPGCANPHPKLIDRVLFAYLTANAAYYTHYATATFADSLTGDSTDFHPLLYAEGAALGGLADYLGAWFPQAHANNLFLAEMSFYSTWRNHPNTHVNYTNENNIQPGGAMWFARQYMVDPLKQPRIFYSSSPRCTGGGTSPVTFTYNGPVESGTAYSFWITRDSDSAVVYPPSGTSVQGISTSYLPVINSVPGRLAIEFSDTSIFPVCILPDGRYTAHLRLGYEGGDRCGYQNDQPVVISSRPVLTVWGDTVFCEGDYSWLRASSGNAYQWYRDSLPLPGAVTMTYKVTKTGNYFCAVSGGSVCGGNTDTVFIYVKPNPMVHINRHCNVSDMTLIANALDTSGTPSVYGDGGVTYQWSTGETTDRITVGYTGEIIRLTVTDPYTGCWRFTDARVTTNPRQTYSVSIQQVAAPTGACIPDGSIQCQYSPTHANPVFYLWNTGESTYNLTDIYPGTYSVMTTVYDNPCSYFASYTLGPLPSGGPSVNETIVPVTCKGFSNGEIQLNLSGGSPPFKFHWENIPIDSLHDPYSQDQNNLFPGNYSVNIYDANGCRFRHRFTVPVSHSGLTLNQVSVSPVTLCSSNSDGAAVVAASGGAAPYLYHWDDPLQQTGASATNLPSGSSRVTVTDANGCKASEFISIPSSPPINFTECDTSVTWLPCAGDSSGLLIYCIYGGTPPFSAALPWIMLDSTHVMATDLQAGNYTVVVTDANGCTASQSAAITEPAPLNIISLSNAATCIGCSNGYISISGSGGVNPYTWSISPQAGNLTDTAFEGLAAGMYEICLTDGNGCIACLNDTVDEEPTMVTRLEVSDIHMEIFPNPTVGSSILKCSGLPVGYNYEIIITDLSGRLISREELNNFNQHHLPEGLVPGMYLAGIISSDLEFQGIWKRWFIGNAE